MCSGSRTTILQHSLHSGVKDDDAVRNRRSLRPNSVMSPPFCAPAKVLMHLNYLNDALAPPGRASSKFGTVGRRRGLPRPGVAHSGPEAPSVVGVRSGALESAAGLGPSLVVVAVAAGGGAAGVRSGARRQAGDQPLDTIGYGVFGVVRGGHRSGATTGRPSSAAYPVFFDVA